jgi:hypothetical protein
MTRSPFLDWLAAPAQPIPPPSRHEAKGPDLVIGYATGYGPKELACFVRSLRAHSSAPIALVASDHPATTAFLADHQVDHWRPPQEPGWTPHLLVGRFKHYLPILAAYSQSRRVLITDVRDVAFQGDPFADGFGDEHAPIALYCETPPGDLGSHGANPKWLNSLIGAPMAQTLATKPVVCGGSIVGQPAALRGLIQTMLWLCAIQRSGGLQSIGADQAALNVVAHQGLCSALAVPNYRRVATIGYTIAPRVTQDGQLANPDGSQSPILHQYDRHPEAKAALEARWMTQNLASITPPKAKGWPKTKARLRKSWARRIPEWR